MVDPLADKFQHLSPYNYADNNPGNNIDPGGKEILYGQGALGSDRYTGEDAVAALQSLKSSSGQDQDGPDDPKKQKGILSAIMKGTIVRKTATAYSLSQVETGDGENSVSEATELGIGFTPLGTYFDFVNAIEGQDRSGNELSSFWRVAGLIPFVSEFNKAERIISASGWVKRTIFNSLDPAIQKKVASALKNGIVAPVESRA